MIIDVPVEYLRDAKIISKGFRQSSLVALTDESDGALLNRDPIDVSFEVDEFEKVSFTTLFVYLLN
ncbi:hypothetical protein OESDEN_13161 [Oesophagostomum dentatum]|uniref:Uncharacterized protein n=1 Tax=Oesophagostomum dentatum TaxID=61180 RepID=A0A0B1SU89_OESDE|nr:hypothetical protein OESDEN_13161 [Oesophagostomum dentatum]